MWQAGWIDALACIADPDLQTTRLGDCSRTNTNAARVRCVAAGIVQQIEQDLRNAITIGHNWRCRWRNFVEHTNLRLLIFWSDDRQCLLYQRVHIERSKIKLYATGFQ